MEYYIGLDVSLQTTFIAIVDKSGKTVEEGLVRTEVSSISSYLSKSGYQTNSQLAIESGQLSISLCKGLRELGFSVVCVDARAMSRVLSNRINKNDKNDAIGIAEMLRAGVYKEVQIKNDESCENKVLLGSRRQMVSIRQQVMGTIRGLLKIYGIKLATSRKEDFTSSALKAISKLPVMSRESIQLLVDQLISIEERLSSLNKIAEQYVKIDDDCKLLMSIPGVGKITAMTYKASLDDPSRFTDSDDVGAYMGLTPRQYSSGEINRHGSISKMGPKDCRTMLYEAAQSLLSVSKKKSRLKSWGLKLMKKKGRKKAIVGVARKLSVIMHRMLIERKEFIYV